MALVLTNVQAFHAGTYEVVLTPVAAVTSSPVQLSVIAPVKRESLREIIVHGSAGGEIALEACNAVSPAAWQPLTNLTLTSSPYYYHEKIAATGQTFYRARVISGSQPVPRLEARVTTALILEGNPGARLRARTVRLPACMWGSRT